MVEFYVNNSYGKTFYELDKDESTTRYYSLFYLESMRTKLDGLAIALSKGTMGEEKSIRDLAIVRNEIKDQLTIFGDDRLPEFENLTSDRFDSSTYLTTTDFLAAIQRVHTNRRDRSVEIKDSIIQVLQKEGKFDQLKTGSHNEEISALVRNSYSTIKILDGRTRLVRKFEPIYSSPFPRHFLNYRTTFYTPVKHFAGGYFRTLYFNTVVLWVMVLMFYCTLYFNLPEQIVKRVEKISKPLV